MLLKAADGCTDEAIVVALNIGIVTVERVRKCFVEAGLDALNERPRPGTQPKLDPKAQARVIAKACSKAPAGRLRWSLQLLAERVVQLQLADACAYALVRRGLKKQAQALAEAAMVHWQSQRRVGRLHGSSGAAYRQAVGAPSDT